MLLKALGPDAGHAQDYRDEGTEQHSLDEVIRRSVLIGFVIARYST
ncbi:MAG TPA: hypothetical protein VNC42_03445 [Bradyrhizobium sp.]|jgi:hypothetical protein|nr:hypothetical protein [Bradyrhizobium sp.]